MPMVADVPSAYEGQPGFDFLTEVPTTWDETRFVQGEPGEYLVLARRQGDVWYLGGITNWTPREIDLPLKFLGTGEYEVKLDTDGSLDESRPNEVSERHEIVNVAKSVHISLAPGGGFVAVIHAEKNELSLGFRIKAVACSILTPTADRPGSPRRSGSVNRRSNLVGGSGKYSRRVGNRCALNPDFHLRQVMIVTALCM